MTAASAKLAAATEWLERICDWRDDLAARLWRAQLRAEYVGLDLHDHDALADEVHAFHSICFSLADSMKLDNERERQAA
jgi:hypothetical protein